AAGLPGGDRLAPPLALRLRAAPPAAARDERRARRDPRRRRLRRRARAPGRVPRGRAAQAFAPALLRARQLGDRRRALELPAPRRARDLGRRRGDALNRALDVAGAVLLAASPVLGLAALAIRLEDGGPVLYRQTRVGKDGRDFELLKLRTM